MNQQMLQASRVAEAMRQGMEGGATSAAAAVPTGLASASVLGATAASSASLSILQALQASGIQKPASSADLLCDAPLLQGMQGGGGGGAAAAAAAAEGHWERSATGVRMWVVSSESNSLGNMHEHSLSHAELKQQAQREWQQKSCYERWLKEGESCKRDATYPTTLFDYLEQQRIDLEKKGQLTYIYISIYTCIHISLIH